MPIDPVILMLEDCQERVIDFKEALSQLDFPVSLVIWRDAASMIKECSEYFDQAVLISLDHDLVPESNSVRDPGTGLEVAEYLSLHQPICPVILHTSNHERRWSMNNAFRFAGWRIEVVPPIGNSWIISTWLKTVKRLISLN